MAQVFLLGFYEEREFALYVSSISNELKVPVRWDSEFYFNAFHVLFKFVKVFAKDLITKFEVLDLKVGSCFLFCSRYLREDKPHGSAGALYYFRDLIMEDAPVRMFHFLLFCCV